MVGGLIAQVRPYSEVGLAFANLGAILIAIHCLLLAMDGVMSEWKNVVDIA
jgi:hypothetical protein